MTLSITAGPYFLSEMLEVNISLTNLGPNSYYVGLPFVSNSCGSWSGVVISGGIDPQYTIPVSTDHSCPYFPRTATLGAGQTLMYHGYQPLTSSGKQTLQASTDFFDSSFSANNAGAHFPRQVTSAFEGHWPALQIDVASHAPVGRQLSYKMDGTRAILQVPNGNIVNGLYLYSVSCGDIAANTYSGTGNYSWANMIGNAVTAPGCDGWKFASVDFCFWRSWIWDCLRKL